MSECDDSSLHTHVRAIEDCNQRGGRMLSLVDLIDAGTVDLPLGGYLAAAMRGGASLLVGAQPGGAGKTAVMCALLNFLPNCTAICPVENQAVLREGQHDARRGEICYLAHEISPARYYAYIWDSEARLFFRLAAQGHIVASNLHADTLAEMRAQLCDRNGVDPAHLAAVTLKLFLRVERRGWETRRWIGYVYESDGAQDRLLWMGDGRGGFTRREPESAVVAPEREAAYAEFLAALRREGIRHIGDVRRALLQEAR